jgi:peptide/nickel transport system permease protein
VPILKLILRRLALGLLTLFVVSVAVFALSQVLPSDPARAVLGREANDETLAAFRAKYGLDESVFTQYTDWAKGILSGEPGLSYSNGQPVMSFLGDRIKNSIFLMVAGSLISIPLSLVIGSYAALRRDKWFDNANSISSLILAAMPEFVVGALVTVLLATNVWHVLPGTVRIRPGTAPWSDPKGLVLPLLTLTLAVTPYVARVVRSSMVEVLESDYVEMARLKGLSERSVLWRHAMPNAIGPTFQVIALNVAYMAGGVVVVESLFNYPGIGLALRDAVREVNLPVVQFLAMLISLIYVLSNLLADLGTIFVTPRLRTRLR